MRFIKSIVVVICLVMTVQSQAQDIHFSQFWDSPLTLNPALTGNFEGNVRVGGIYRNQWNSIIPAYSTPSISVDLPISVGIGKNDWMGVGLYMLNDRSGSGALNNLTGMLSVAYHKSIGSSAKHFLSIAGQAGLTQKRIDTEKLTFADEYANGGFPGQTGEIFENSSFMYADVNAGATWRSFLSDKFDFTLGFTYYHFTNPKEEFLGTTNTLDSRMAFTGMFNYDLSKRFTITPMALYQRQAEAQELNISARLAYHINPDDHSPTSFFVGGGYRVGDAGVLLTGFEFNKFRLGLAYDVNTSSLSDATNGNGAFELSLTYIAKTAKTPVVKPILFCPRF